MSIKIEGDGNKENVFSDSDSGMPLWNGTPFGLLPPDLRKTQEATIAGPDQNGIPVVIPFTVPQDGWITDIASNYNNVSCTIDGINGGPRIKVIQHLDFGNNSVFSLVQSNTPYPVKKGQVISVKESGSITQISFAPCMSV